MTLTPDLFVPSAATLPGGFSFHYVLEIIHQPLTGLVGTKIPDQVGDDEKEARKTLGDDEKEARKTCRG